MLENYIDNLKDDIVKETCNLVNIPSVSEETNSLEAPFGEGCKKVLNYALNLGDKLGFKTKNIDNYCGYIEFGKCEKLVGIIGHLDVVPSGDGWDTPPFLANIRDGKIYGRGSIDDKGPVISSLYAMKAVKDNLNINSRVRLILGLNEEKDWKCINYYKTKEEFPSIGFSPDADFPCIYAEKGIATIFIKEDYEKYKDAPIKINNIDCANNAINVVPKYCSVQLDINLEKIDIDNICSFIENIINSNHFDISYTVSNSNIFITSKGIQAHAAHPNLGKNAISQVLVLLYKLFTNYNIDIHLLDFFANKIGMEYNGNSLDININDESGNLTLNVGKFEFFENSIQVGLNLRIPVNTSIDEIFNKITDTCNSYNLETSLLGRQEPLYVSKNDPLVKTLCNIYNKYTNSDLEPIPIGGGTYARAFKNFVSFGANFPGDIDVCHQANEFVDINKLILSCKIYAEAIFELAK